jgi:hypothetical protein
MERNLNVSINLKLSHEELSQLYWMIYGTSLVEYTNAPEVNKGFTQIVEQLESFLIQKNPDCIFEIDAKKKDIQDYISKNKK